MVSYRVQWATYSNSKMQSISASAVDWRRYYPQKIKRWTAVGVNSHRNKTPRFIPATVSTSQLHVLMLQLDSHCQYSHLIVVVGVRVCRYLVAQVDYRLQSTWNTKRQYDRRISCKINAQLQFVWVEAIS